MSAEPYEPSDREKCVLGFGEGGVPWLLLVGYLAFLAFFTWYTVEFQLVDFEKQGPFPIGESTSEAAGDQ